MAVPKPKPMAAFKQPKQPVYSALCGLNQAFDSIAAEIESLEESDAIPAKTLQLYRATAEDLRAGINHRLTGALHLREAKDWWEWGGRVRKVQS